MTESMRCCVVCRIRSEKKRLFRFSRTVTSIVFDALQTAQGRGYYVCRSQACLQKLYKNQILNHKTGLSVPDEIYLEAEKWMLRNTQ